MMFKFYTNIYSWWILSNCPHKSDRKLKGSDIGMTDSVRHSLTSHHAVILRHNVPILYLMYAQKHAQKSLEVTSADLVVNLWKQNEKRLKYT